MTCVPVVEVPAEEVFGLVVEIDGGQNDVYLVPN